MAAAWSKGFERYGTWWNSRDPTNRTTGRLVFDPQTGLRLTTASASLVTGSLWTDDQVVIVGSSQGEYWTLADCMMKSTSAGGEEFIVSYAIAGLGMNRDELNSIDEIRVSFQGSWELMPQSPRGPRQLDRSPVSLTATLSDELTIRMETELIDLGPSPAGVFEFMDRVTFVGKIAHPMSFVAINKAVLGPLRDLITLAHQRGANIDHCEVSGPGTVAPPHAQPQVAAVYWQHIERPQTSADANESPLLKIPSTQNDFQRLLSSWFELHALLELPIGLRVADLVAGMTFAATRFLLAAQALEAMHRRLYPDERDEPSVKARAAALAVVEPENRAALTQRLSHADEPTFRNRLKQLQAEAEPEIGRIVGPQLKDAVVKIVKTRNDVTHWDPASDEPDGLLLIALRQVADALFDIVLLKRLGANIDDLEGAIGAHRSKSVEYWLGRALDEEARSKTAEVKG